jgi:hypothetical protein
MRRIDAPADSARLRPTLQQRQIEQVEAALHGRRFENGEDFARAETPRQNFQYPEKSIDDAAALALSDLRWCMEFSVQVFSGTPKTPSMNGA